MATDVEPANSKIVAALVFLEDDAEAEAILLLDSRGRLEPLSSGGRFRSCSLFIWARWFAGSLASEAVGKCHCVCFVSVVK
jgi:hypothetical protein